MARHPLAQLVTALEQSMAADDVVRARLFHEKLRGPHVRSEHSGSGNYQSRLIAVRVERRSIAVVIMKGDSIQYEKVRQLSSDSQKAVSSALAFISWIVDQFECPSAVLEPVPRNTETQRAVLATEIIRLLRERSVTVWEVAKKQLFAALGYPPLKSRAELREVISAVFPFLNGGYGAAFLRDAAALGLFVHLERLFIS